MAHGGERLREPRYSGLDQIHAGNAKDLKLAFTFSTGVLRGHEAAPYIVTPYPNFLYALDLTKPGAPAKWTCEPSPTRMRARRAWPVATW